MPLRYISKFFGIDVAELGCGVSNSLPVNPWTGRGPAIPAKRAEERAAGLVLAVRCLMPAGRGRLRGIPGNHTSVPRRKGCAADGPRRKAAGGTAVPRVARIVKRVRESHSAHTRAG